MADINVLIDRIMDEANEQANAIKGEADKKAQAIIEEGQALSQKRYNSILERGKADAQNARERLLSSAELKCRNEQLKAKQEVISRVFDEALEGFKAMDKAEYLNYIKENVRDIDGSKIIVVREMLDAVKAELPELTIDEERFVDTGFIQTATGIENNYTFEAKLEYLRDELEGEVARILFDNRG